MGRSALIDLSQSRWRAADSSASHELWLLHGYASHEDDLFGLARLIPPSWNVRSLQAPLALPTGGFAWYDLHFDAQGVRHVDPTQVWASLNSLATLLEQNPIKPVILGFSQGGILANALAASHPDLIAGCAAVASYFPNDWFDSDLPWKAVREMPHLAVIGDEDGVIPPTLSVPSYDTANARGAGIEVQRFRMGHGIAPDSWQAIARWLATF
jgi:phospholipase/carboxylesterase